MRIIIGYLYLKNQLFYSILIMNSSSLDIFFPIHSDSEAPISVITQILSEDKPLKFLHISNEFCDLDFTKVKDLAGATKERVGMVNLLGDPLAQLNRAMEIYSEYLDKLLNSAKSEHQNGNFKETQKICIELLTHKPTDLNVILLNAKSYFNCENYEKCIEYLEKAKNINPNCTEVYSNFALVYQKKSENELAKDCLFEVCKRKPYCVEAWIHYADLLFETNDLITADVAYTRVLALRPELYKVRNELGKVQLKLNNLKEAKKEFKIAHNNAKNCPVILNNLADVYYKRGKFRKSILKYEQLLEINPDLANACFYLGMAYLKVKEYQNAANAFNKALALEPENVSILKNLAVTYCHLDDMALCSETYKKCLNLKPDDFNLNMELGLVYLNNIKNYQEAAIYLNKCIQLNPDRIDVYEKIYAVYMKLKDHINASDACMSMGDIYLEKKDLVKAKNAFCCAALTNTNNAFAHWKMGITLYSLGKSDLALKKYKHAIAIRPDFPDAYCDMGIIYDEGGRFEQAKVHYKMAIKLNPTHIMAKLNLDDLKEKMNPITDKEEQ